MLLRKRDDELLAEMRAQLVKGHAEVKKLTVEEFDSALETDKLGID